MTTKSKNRLLSLGLMIVGTLFICGGLQACHSIAYAQGAVDSARTQEQDSFSVVLDMLMSGQYLPAVGALLVALVALMRSGLTKITWHGVGAFFTTQMGGYMLAYGTAVMLYLGTAFEQSQPITMKLVLMGAVAALTASGLLDHWRDVLGMVKKVPPTAVLLLIGFSALGCEGCKSVEQSRPAQAIIVCLEQNQDAIKAGAGDCGQKAPDWSAVEACVVMKLPEIGVKVGGCVIAQLVQDYLTKRVAAKDVPQTHAAHDALEHYRATYADGATFRTAKGDL